MGNICPEEEIFDQEKENISDLLFVVLDQELMSIDFSMGQRTFCSLSRWTIEENETENKTRGIDWKNAFH